MNSSPLVRDIMSSPIAKVKRGETMRKAIHLMSERRIGSVLVEPGSGYAQWKIFTKTDYRQAISDKASSDTPIEKYAKNLLFTADPNWTCEQARDFMSDCGVKHLPVIRGGQPVGMVSMQDTIYNCPDF